MLPEDLDPEVVWYFDTLTDVVAEISPYWATIIRVHEKDITNVCVFLCPAKNVLFDSQEDYEESEIHPDRVLVEFKDGLMFLKPTPSVDSQWMATKVRNDSKLAGRVI